MQVHVDRDLCEANGICEDLVPRVFRLRDDDELELLEPRPDEDVLDDVRLAVEKCPRQALRLVGD